MDFGCKGWGQFGRTVLQLKTPQRRPKGLSTSMSTTTTTKSFRDGKGAKTAGGRCHWKPQSQSWIQVVKLVSFILSWRPSTGIFSSGRTETESNHKSSGRKQRKSLPKDYKGLKVACWKSKAMLNLADSSRPESRSALVAHELSRFDVDIAALSKVRFPEEGCLKEKGAGYTIYRSGKPSTEKRLSGVGFTVRTSIVSKLETLPSRHSDGIASMRLPLNIEQHLTLFSVCSPTLRAEPAEKERFYFDLRSLLQSTPAADKVLILGDFNARVGRDTEAWKGVLGRHGVGNCNDNGRLLLEFCSEQQLTITSTIFQQRDNLKTTWMHPRSKLWRLLDFVLVRRSDLKDVLHTRVMPSAECHTDQRLVRYKPNLQFKPKPKKSGPRGKKRIVSDLRSAEVEAKFQAVLHSLLHSLKRTGETPSKTNNRGGKLKLLSPLKTQTWPTCADTAWGPACLASASSATNGPAVGIDNNLPDPRLRSQAKQSLSSILTSQEADFDSLAKLAGWLSVEVPPPILAVFLPCRLS